MTRSAPLSRGSVAAARIGLLGDSESAHPVHAGLEPLRPSQAPGRQFTRSAQEAALKREEETALHPTGKPYRDEPSGDVAVQSDSALPSQAVTKLKAASESGLTADLTPVPPAEPARKRDAPATPASFG